MGSPKFEVAICDLKAKGAYPQMGKRIRILSQTKKGVLTANR
jgi:hypothetical protein